LKIACWIPQFGAKDTLALSAQAKTASLLIWISPVPFWALPSLFSNSKLASLAFNTFFTRAFGRSGSSVFACVLVPTAAVALADCIFGNRIYVFFAFSPYLFNSTPVVPLVLVDVPQARTKNKASTVTGGGLSWTGAESMLDDQ
jgi:hypothetical protein